MRKGRKEARANYVKTKQKIYKGDKNVFSKRTKRIPIKVMLYHNS